MKFICSSLCNYMAMATMVLIMNMLFLTKIQQVGEMNLQVEMWLNVAYVFILSNWDKHKFETKTWDKMVVISSQANNNFSWKWLGQFFNLGQNWPGQATWDIISWHTTTNLNLVCLSLLTLSRPLMPYGIMYRKLINSI